MLQKSKYLNRWDKLSKTTIRVVCPSGTGKLPIMKYIRDPKSGAIHGEITGYTNLQEKMNKEASELDFMNMLQEVEAGTRKRVEGFSNASAMPQSSYEARKRIESLINKWDKNPLLRLVYPSKEALLKELNEKNGDKLVLDRVKKFGAELVKPIEDDTKKTPDVPKTTQTDIAPKSAPVENKSEVK